MSQSKVHPVHRMCLKMILLDERGVRHAPYGGGRALAAVVGVVWLIGRVARALGGK